MFEDAELGASSAPKPLNQGGDLPGPAAFVAGHRSRAGDFVALRCAKRTRKTMEMPGKSSLFPGHFLVFLCPGAYSLSHTKLAHIVCFRFTRFARMGAGGEVPCRGGRIPPPPVADTGGRRPNETQSATDCACAVRSRDDAELWFQEPRRPLSFCHFNLRVVLV